MPPNESCVYIADMQSFIPMYFLRKRRESRMKNTILMVELKAYKLRSERSRTSILQLQAPEGDARFPIDPPICLIEFSAFGSDSARGSKAAKNDRVFSQRPRLKRIGVAQHAAACLEILTGVAASLRHSARWPCHMRLHPVILRTAFSSTSRGSISPSPLPHAVLALECLSEVDQLASEVTSLAHEVIPELVRTAFA